MGSGCSNACADFSKAVVEYATLMPDFSGGREAAANGARELIEEGITEILPVIDMLVGKSAGASA